MTDRVPPLPQRLRRVPHVAQRRIGDEVVVLDLRKSRIYGFNPAAGHLLEELRSGSVTEELFARARAAGSDGSALAGFLADLVERGLVTGDGDPVSGCVEAEARFRFDAEPRLLWQEDAARVTHQISPPQAITNPQCQP